MNRAPDMKPFDTPSVMKFGGSSFATQARIEAVCQWIGQRLEERGRDHRVVCVVSAPSGLTEQYRETLLKLNPTPSDRLIDAGLPLADSLGAVLVAAALQAQALSATVTLGNQIGLRTDRNYTRARLESVDLSSLRRELQTHQVVVVPGGQAASALTGETTWMGKNSSDLSAIALAAALGCEALEIYSDVPGVYSCDPNIVASAYLLPALSHQQAVSMSRSGAKVLHHRGVEHAQAHSLRIVCRRNHGEFEVGTVLTVGATPTPAVIPDARSQVFSGLEAVIDQAARELEVAGVPHLLVDDAQAGRRLVITCGFFDARHFLLTERQLDLVEQDLRLLSVIGPDGGILRELVPTADLVNRARASHAGHCTAERMSLGPVRAPDDADVLLSTALMALPNEQRAVHV